MKTSSTKLQKVIIYSVYIRKFNNLINVFKCKTINYKLCLCVLEYKDRLKNLRDIYNKIEIEDNAFGKLFECY